MPLALIYSASKAAVERWAEALHPRSRRMDWGSRYFSPAPTAPNWGDGAAVYRDDSGPYGPQHPRMEKRGRAAVRLANPPEKFAKVLAKALERDRQPIVHRGAGIDAKVYRTVARLLPPIAMHHVIRFGLGQPRFGALRNMYREKPNSVK